MNKSPSTSNSSPNLTSISGTGENTSQRKRKQPESEITNAINTLTADMNKRLDGLRSYFDSSLTTLSDNIATIKTDLATVSQTTSDIKTELSSLRSEHAKLQSHVAALEDKHDNLSCEVASLHKSLQYTSDQQDELSKRVDSMSEHCKNSEILNNSIITLEAKIDTLEQQARQCNIEICNIPEKRSENLIALMENICTKINCSISQKDIIAIHRVPHAHKQNNKPKNIIVKLCSRILRDNILSAFRLKKGMKTDELGISGTPQPFYMNEHLTLRNKQLFRECREAASKNKFKFVWVKHATILVRESDGDSAMAIRSPQDILKIKPGAGASRHH